MIFATSSLQIALLEGKMAVVNSYFSPVQSPFHIQQQQEVELPEDISNFDDDADVSCKNEDGLSASKSVESLTTLLNCLPDIVIPEPLYNPLPLQCLAASALPEAVCREIQQVIEECSSMTSTASPTRRSQADQDSSFESELEVLEQDNVTSGLKEERTIAEEISPSVGENSVVSSSTQQVSGLWCGITGSDKELFTYIILEGKLVLNESCQIMLLFWLCYIRLRPLK